MPFTLLAQGSFTSTGSAVNIDLPGEADYFVARNLTNAGSQANPGEGVMFEWFRGLTDDNEAIETKKLNSSDTTEVVEITSGGFKYVTSLPAPEAEVTGTAITNANPAVVTSNSHGYSDDDIIRLYGTTGMRQIAGMDFQISSTSANNYTLLGLDASGFAASATALNSRRIPAELGVAPRFLYITNISQAAEAEVTVTREHNFQVGQVVEFNVPKDNSMVEMNGLKGEVQSATGTNSPAGSSTYKFTVDIDSTGFTAFDFPADSEVPTARLFATVQPEGQRGTYDVTNVPYRSDPFLPYMHLPAGADSPAGNNNDEIVWQAWKAET